MLSITQWGIVAICYKIQRYVVHICGLLEMGSDSFLSTTPQKLNIFLRSFFFSTIKKIVLLRFIKFKYHLVLSILQISKCLSTYRWGIANCNTAQNWSSHSQSKGDVADKHDHNNHSSDALQVGAVIHCSRECQFRDNTFNSDQRGGSLSFTEMKLA